MKKRDFLKTSAILSMGAIMGPLISCENNTETKKEGGETTSTNSVFELPPLDYSFNALEPHIDARTMEIHHGKHHAGYTKKFNKAIVVGVERKQL